MSTCLHLSQYLSFCLSLCLYLCLLVPIFISASDSLTLSVFFSPALSLFQWWDFCTRLSWTSLWFCRQILSFVFPVLAFRVVQYTFLVVSHDSIRGCVRPSVRMSIRWSVRRSVGPLVRNLFFGGPKQRRRTTYFVYTVYNNVKIVKPCLKEH